MISRGIDSINRSFESIERHYLLEKKLAQKLKNSSRVERKELYSKVYDELFEKIVDHPQLIRKEDPEKKINNVLRRVNRIRPFLNENISFLEVGAGDCSFSFEISKYVSSVIAVDVSSVISLSEEAPDNFKLEITDGFQLPVADSSIDVAYSRMLIEHLHVDDVNFHLVNINNILKDGGIYVLETCHPFNGPHDISRFFSDVATGFHLKEWSYRELSEELFMVGFKKVKSLFTIKGYSFMLPVNVVIILERFLGFFPKKLRKKLCHTRRMGIPLKMCIVAYKLKFLT